ncbi:hemerythrin domain-containing protein [Streptomyces sp. NPDC048623]|uniref:hemerythrin domain-containing protein n=1 Tax=Streptomyces sp. NPDC048623 TaxID=3155761 RepID=UPI00343D2C26
MAPHHISTDIHDHDGDRVVALRRQLHRAHEELERRMREIRTHIGRRRLTDDELLTHCLAFCTALTNHHQGEDRGMFAQLLRERPDLAPTIEKLVEDHGLITSILTRVRALADTAADTAAEPPGSDPEKAAAIAAELDGLAAIMASHFRYEERAIGEALDSAVPDPDPGWPEAVFGFEPPA